MQQVSQVQVSGKNGPQAPVTDAPQAAPAIAPPSGNRPEKRVAMTRIRQRIAERLLESQQNAAILTTFNEVNMQPVIELRNKYKDAFEKKHGIKLGFSSFFVKAAVLALQKFPIVNASVDGTDIVYHGYFDIGMAIGSERGLVVPIIRDADKYSLADIEKQIADFGARAKVGKLNTDSNQEMPVKYGIQAIPSVLIFKGGQVVQKFIGLANKKELQAALDRAATKA